MSLNRNILVSYASQIYVALIGILLLPLYIKYMGAEAYGLVGFFTMLQALFSILDLGLTPTIGRETARFHGGAMTALAYRQLFRALSLIFASIAVGGGGVLLLLSGMISTRWLNVVELPMAEVTLAVQIMAISVALRWMGGLYRGVITGSERLVWLGGFSAFIATLRFVAVFASMLLYGFTPFVFFIHQMAVALLEAVGLYLMSQRLLPVVSHLGQPIGWSFKPVKPLLKFTLTIAFTASVSVFVTYTDKLILSGILPLAEYGYFTLAVLVASGITVIGAPISNALMPRMVKLHAEGKHAEMMKIYSDATEFVCVVVGSATIALATCAEPLLFAWTGDAQIASAAAPIMRLYAIGNGLLSIAAFSYYLQYAIGNLRYHLLGNVAMAIILIPCIFIAAIYFGSVGVGYVWLGINFSLLAFWVAYIHHNLVPGLHFKWLVKNVLKIIIPAILIALLMVSANVGLEGRMQSIIYVVVVGLAAASVSLCCSGVCRNWMIKFFISCGS